MIEPHYPREDFVAQELLWLLLLLPFKGVPWRHFVVEFRRFALGPVDLRGTWSRNLVPADLLNFCDFFLALPSYSLLFFAFLWIRAIYGHVTTRS
jgi:hypothetical protein